MSGLRATSGSWLRSREGILTLAGVAILAVYPLVMPRFWVLSIASNAIILGIAALSLIFMAGYGGMVSLRRPPWRGSPPTCWPWRRSSRARRRRARPSGSRSRRSSER